MEKTSDVSKKIILHNMFEFLRIPKERWEDTALLCRNFSKYADQGEAGFAMDYINAFATGFESTGSAPNWTVDIFRSLTASLGQTSREAQEIIITAMKHSKSTIWLWQEADVEYILAERSIPEERKEGLVAFLSITLGYLENQHVEAALDFIDAYIFGAESTWKPPAWAMNLGIILKRKVREWESRIQQASDLSRETIGRIMNLGEKPD